MCHRDRLEKSRGQNVHRNLSAPDLGLFCAFKGSENFVAELRLYKGGSQEFAI